MNEAAKSYWDEYWGGKVKPEFVSVWKFGTDSDNLAQLVVDGVKTATCSAYIFYELEKQALPTTKDYNIILNDDHQSVAITKTTEVTIIPMNEVSEEFAIAEGEGTYQNWWSIHEEYFTERLKAVGLEFSEDLLIVCERFEVIHVK
ncbi:MAG TPA: ASCH domain-containing protein [Candidatus Avipropionibacterium sp.]|nr:ASCH domain-containing protein [Candidatus Avipropionibacterium sp.]